MSFRLWRDRSSNPVISTKIHQIDVKRSSRLWIKRSDPVLQSSHWVLQNWGDIFPRLNSTRSFPSVHINPPNYIYRTSCTENTNILESHCLWKKKRGCFSPKKPGTRDSTDRRVYQLNWQWMENGEEEAKTTMKYSMYRGRRSTLTGDPPSRNL